MQSCNHLNEYIRDSAQEMMENFRLGVKPFHQGGCAENIIGGVQRACHYRIVERHRCSSCLAGIADIFNGVEISAGFYWKRLDVSNFLWIW